MNRGRWAWLLLCVGRGMAQSADGGAAETGIIEVEVIGLKVPSGSMLMSLHASADTFPGKAMQAVRHEWVPVAGDTLKYTFVNVPYGTWAVGAAHDENGNGKIDTGIFRIPVEGIGVSNNPFSLGPPSFSRASFQVSSPVTRLQIKLR